MTAPAPAVLDPADAARAEQSRADLLARGYAETTAGPLAPGTRVRHSGEQYDRAYTEGTAVVLGVYEKNPSPWSQTYGQRDIEVVVLRDRPMLDGMSRVGAWADYHTRPVTGR